MIKHSLAMLVSFMIVTFCFTQGNLKNVHIIPPLINRWKTWSFSNFWSFFRCCISFLFFNLSYILRYLVILYRSIETWLPRRSCLRSSLILLDLQVKNPPKAKQGTPLRKPPTEIQTHSVSQNQSMTPSLTKSAEAPSKVGASQSSSFVGAECYYENSPQGWFSAEGSGCTGFWYGKGLPLLSERHSRILRGGCSLRTIFAKHVPSFTPVAQHHLFREKGIPLYTTMEVNFPS